MDVGAKWIRDSSEGWHASMASMGDRPLDYGECKLRRFDNEVLN